MRTGQVLTQTAPARTTTGYRALLQTLDQADPHGARYRLTATRSSHRSGPMRDWLAEHPRIQQACLPVGAAWLTVIDGWWRLCRRTALANASRAHAEEIADATCSATAPLNRQAHPGVGGRPPPRHRTLRRCVTSRL